MSGFNAFLYGLGELGKGIDQGLEKRRQVQQEDEDRAIAKKTNAMNLAIQLGDKSGFDQAIAGTPFQGLASTSYFDRLGKKDRLEDQTRNNGFFATAAQMFQQGQAKTPQDAYKIARSLGYTGTYEPFTSLTRQKTVASQLDLGNRIKVTYSDGSVEILPKAAAPQSYTPQYAYTDDYDPKTGKTTRRYVQVGNGVASTFTQAPTSAMRSATTFKDADEAAREHANKVTPKLPDFATTQQAVQWQKDWQANYLEHLKAYGWNVDASGHPYQPSQTGTPQTGQGLTAEQMADFYAQFK